MKKIYSLACILLCLNFITNAQSIIYDHGPLVNSPGAGAGGADVSNTHDGLINFGNSQSFTAGFYLSDSFTVPAGETWNIDSVILYGYQTNSTTTSTFTDLYAYILDKSPDDPTAVILFGDSITNIFAESNWSGVYRTSETTLTNTARPIMRNSGTLTALLTAGTYWLAWSQAGSGTLSGPWNPPITVDSTTITGNALQFVLASLTWVPVIDTAQSGSSDDATQGFPFSFVGNTSAGINDVHPENSLSIYPNPFLSETHVILNSGINLSNQPAAFIISDVLGNTVSKMEGIRNRTFTVERNKLNAGIYVYRLTQGNKIVNRGKLIVTD